jgi:hypothetical protein
MLISCSLMSRFFLNLRAVAYENPWLLPRGTTGFALDTTSPQMLMAKIFGRGPANQKPPGGSVEIEATRRPDETDLVEVSDDRI